MILGASLLSTTNMVCHRLDYIIVVFLAGFCGAQLVVNVKNKGGEVTKENIQANTTQDVITLEFQKSDGILITQLIDFKNEIQIYRVIVPGEEELGQNQFQSMCFVVRFVKNEFISSDAMSKLRQKNPNAIRHPEDDKGEELITYDLHVDPARSYAISPHIKSFCDSAKDATYARETDLNVISKTLDKDYNTLLESTRYSNNAEVTTCRSISVYHQPCLCRFKVCIGWYPCGLKYCHGKDSAGKVVNYRCGIKTCSKCRSFDYYVRQKQYCLWDTID